MAYLGIANHLCPGPEDQISQNEMKHVFVISDGTGRTAQQALEAALTQFPETEIDIRVCPGVRSRDQVRGIMEQAAKVGGFVLHTVVSAGNCATTSWNRAA